MATNLKIEYIPINDVTPYGRNAKKHPEEQIEQIIKSIEEFGMNDPIAVYGKNNLIIEGHGRLIACQRLGHTFVPVIRLDHLTDDQRKAYTLIHNKLTMNSDFDLIMLAEEIEAIDCVDMGDFGFLPDTDMEEVDDVIGLGDFDTERDDEGHLVECPCCGNTFKLDKRFKLIE